MRKEDESKNFRVFLKSIAEKWRKQWEDEGLYEAEPLEGKPKFYLTAAYPYPNAPLHIGHARTYTIPDVIARYKRMRGYNVLFPMAFHYTGTPIISMSEAIAKGDKELIDLYTKLYGIPQKDIEKLKTPLGMANYFREMAREDLKNLLLAIDWRREFTTIDPEYNRFIVWQFEKLREKGLIVQGTHPVGWCPVHGNPVSMHDTKGDVEPEIQEFTIIYFREKNGDTYYPAATLRPETVLGVTNMWVNPKARYVIARINGRKVVLSDRAFFKIRFQKKNVEKLAEIKGEDLVGRRVVNPVTGRVVPVLPSEFVDPDTGTGVVMSVPAHAPYDYAALRDVLSQDKLLETLGVSPESLRPIPLIVIEGYSETPAKDVVEKLGVKSASDRKLLDEATKRVYLDEHEKGVMRRGLSSLVNEEKALPGSKDFVEKEIEGKPVREVREIIRNWMMKHGVGDVFYEIANKPVYSRCGNEIVVKILENQWFIDYENKEWKELARKALARMEIVPDEYRQQFENTIDWLKKRACARSRGLGTRLPWDPEWIIESLSDSTIYMAFYTVIKGIREHGIKPESLKPVFWDYVFLGKGGVEEVSKETGVPPEVLEKLRREFMYWYPLDNRHSGKDLIPNHLTFFIFNHAAIFPESLWPKRIVVNGHVMVEGEKMSKSLGNIIPIRRAVGDAGPDAVRLTLVYSAEVGNDANYTRELLDSVIQMLERIYKLFREALQSREESETGLPEKLLTTRVRRAINEVTESLEKYRLRDAAIRIFSMIEQYVRDYASERGVSSIPRKVLEVWARLMAPFTPSFAEELWRMLGNNTSVFKAKWPTPDELPAYPELELGFLYAQEILEDVRNIMKALKKKPSKVRILVSSGNEEKAGEIIRALMKAETQRDAVKAVREYMPEERRPHEIARRLQSFLHKLPSDLLEIIKANGFNEVAVLSEFRDWLEKKVGCPVSIEEYSKEAVAGKRKGKAYPLRPLILLEF